MYVIPKKWAAIPFTFFLLVALSTNVYIVPQFVVFKICLTTFNQSVCDQLGQPKFKTQEDYVYERTAAWNGLINFAGYFPALIITLPLGAMTDLVSKHKMFLIPVVVTIVSSLINLCSSVFITLHVGFLVLASFLTCAYGEIAGCVTLACTYAANNSSEDERTVVICLVAASVEMGLAIGGLVGNYIANSLGFPSVFLFATVLSIVNLLYTVILIPPANGVDVKSSEGEQYGLWSGVKEHTKDTCHHLVSFTKKHLFQSMDNQILLLLIAAFLNLASYGGERAIIALFLKHSPLNLKANQIGIYITMFHCFRGFGLMILSFVVNRHCLSSDYFLMFIGASGMIIHYVFTSFSTTTTMVYCSTIFATSGSFMASAVRSKLTTLVDPESHGVSLSLLGLLDTLSQLIMAVGANGIFTATAKIYSGFSVLLMSFTNLVSLVILCYTYCTKEFLVESTDEYQKVSKDDNQD